MDEASGTRVDSHGSNDLSQTGTVSSTTGKIGNAATVNNNNYLSCPSNANLNPDTTGLTVAFWFQLGGTPSFWQVLGKGQFTAATPYALAFESDSILRLYTGGNTGWSSALSPSTWYFVCARISIVSGTNITRILSVDNGTPVTGSGILSTGNTDPFTVGQQPLPFSPINHQVDELGIWKRVLSDSEVTELYNNGNGLSYSDLASPPAASKVPAMYHHLNQMGA